MWVAYFSSLFCQEYDRVMYADFRDIFFSGGGIDAPKL